MKYLKLLNELFNNSGKIVELRNCESNNPKVKKYLDQFSKVPESFKNALYQYGVKIVFFSGQLTDNPELEHYRGVVPRGYPSHLVWDYLDGMYLGDEKIVFIGIDGSYYATDKERFPDLWKPERDIFLHELGHALDDSIGDVIFGNSISKLKEIPGLMKTEPFPDRPGSKIKGYYNSHVREYLANAFEQYLRSSDTKETMKMNQPSIYNILKKVEVKL
jgi:Pro-Pro endopeptidase